MESPDDVVRCSPNEDDATASLKKNVFGSRIQPKQLGAGLHITDHMTQGAVCGSDISAV